MDRGSGGAGFPSAAHCFSRLGAIILTDDRVVAYGASDVAYINNQSKHVEQAKRLLPLVKTVYPPEYHR
ncbi:hypothetical protein BG74_07975 [Sodalis-like endosymbiont of Proechinophthirus fluctus]|uniref:hypothetical protein n=1 Tax=Sodalis-like endosymbiont of Proechinophthirus fluctus TaxID=1462730 RepID=UPI0007A8E263|nr:hypothetical protein [Sodalis-like endosymbiont of Proechinophthirus fluctus]KYP95935.1 hypothetical protein BG74_07975 [Sodalis-like endosymbiont of Proechinophthirus fluctus]